MRAFRWILWTLIAIDLFSGLLMFVSPTWFGALANFPVKDAPVMRGYGERIALLALVYIWLAQHQHPTRAAWLIWLPALDEWVNTLADAFELLSGGMPASVVGPMLATHAILAVALTLVTWRVGKREE
jgi:hypothetical protein